MIYNLFSIFEPTTRLLELSWGWLAAVITSIFLLRCFWLKRGRFRVVIKRVIGGLRSEILLNFKKKETFLILIPLRLFITILVINVFGLFPWVFTPSSHLSYTLGLSLPLWLGLIGFGLTQRTITTLAHLVPQGTPVALIRFIVVIETVSNIIRPITLAVRLRANMIAGHLLIALLRGAADLFEISSVIAVRVGLFTLLILETAVAIIQSYVFITLISLYIREV